MSVRNIGSNQTEVVTSDGKCILVSYSTPVAAYIPGRGYIRTGTRHSVTTSRHINKWLDGVNAEMVPQSELDSLI